MGGRQPYALLNPVVVSNNALRICFKQFLYKRTHLRRFMKTLIPLVLVIQCFVVTLAAQERHPLEASGGVSGFTLEDGRRKASYGWNIGFGIGVHRNISIATEFSGYTGGSDYVHE